MFYIAYLGVTIGMLRKRIRGEWPRPDHGPYFILGRWGLPVNIVAVVYGAIVAVNIAWPRAAVYERWRAPSANGTSSRPLVLAVHRDPVHRDRS